MDEFEVSTKEDAVFIAHVRTDIPALLAEVERLTNCKCIDKCKLVCMLDDYNKIVKERDTLKKALEIAGKTLEKNFPPTKAQNWIDVWEQQAQEQETHHAE